MTTEPNEPLIDLRARPHINGNTPDDFVRAGLAISAAVRSLDLALTEMVGTVLHGRNYQHYGERGQEARAVDLRRFKTVQAHLDEFEHLVTEIHMAASTGRR